MRTKCTFELLALLLIAIASSLLTQSNANLLLQVRRKFPRNGAGILANLRAHDDQRRGRMLSAVDISMGGTANPATVGLYFAEIVLGSPGKKFHVQVDTGSDLLWVNCAGCSSCPSKTNLGFKLQQYNPAQSITGSSISCLENFCSSLIGNGSNNCQTADCEYILQYGDGSTTTGLLVNDIFQYNKVTGNLQSSPGNASVIFGCSTKQSGDLSSPDDAVDGIFGFGQSSTSVLSQLSSSGKVPKIFGHCLGTDNGGGGIFAIGNVVQPKVPRTPLVPNQPHYNVYLEGIEVGGLALNTELFASFDQTGAVIDSGTTLAYLPEDAYAVMVEQITRNHQNLLLQDIQGFLCFPYTANVDNDFPLVSFVFNNSLTLKVYPREYLFEIEVGMRCIGFQNSSSQNNTEQFILLGDLVLSNKFVLYDLENQELGWTDYNCSSSIKVQDENTNAIFTVGAHDLSQSSRSEIGRIMLLLLLLLSTMLNLLTS